MIHISKSFLQANNPSAVSTTISCAFLSMVVYGYTKLLLSFQLFGFVNVVVQGHSFAIRYGSWQLHSYDL